MNRPFVQSRDFPGYMAMVFLALAAVAGVYYYGFAPHHFRVAVPPARSEPAELFSAMAQALKRDGSRVRLGVTTHDSNEEIVAAMESGKVDLAVVRSDRPFPRASLGVAQVQEMHTLILARPDANINSFADLKGHRVAEIGRVKSGTGIIAELMAFNQMKPGDIEFVDIYKPQALAQSISSSKIDALILVLPRGSQSIGEAIRTLTQAFEAPPTIVPLKEAAAIATRIPAMEAAEIAIGELSANPQLPAAATPTLTFPVLLVARQKLDNAEVQELTRELFNVRNSLMSQYPAAARLAALDTERGGNFAVHPGAATYYDAAETPFLERYSDMLWLLLFGFSSIVSALVWFLRRLFPERMHNMRSTHTELVDLLRNVRGTSDPAALDAAENRIDEIVVEISKLSFEGKLDEDQRPAFDLMIERLSKVIEDRRRILAE